MTPVLTCRDLAVGYNGHTAATISFSAMPGDYICITGENGAGKTTFMKTVLGLIPAVSGKVLLKPDNRSGIGYLPQQNMIQKNFPASVKEVILSGRPKSWKPFYTEADKKSVDDVIAQLNIPKELLNRHYGALSGGQQQRVLLARALCSNPCILFLDEPVTGLDPDVTKKLYAILKKLNREKNITILMITHDTQALQYASHILQFSHGNVSFIPANSQKGENKN